MPEQSRVEPGMIGAGSSPSTPPDMARGTVSASVSKTSASIESATIASQMSKAAEAFRPVDMARADAPNAKFAAVSPRPRDGKATAPRAEFQQQSSPVEKRRMSSVAPETAKAAEQAKEPARSDASRIDVTKVETPRMPPPKVVVTPLGERAWEIKGLTPPKASDAGKSAEQAKTDAPRQPKTARFNAARLAGKILALASLASRLRGNRKGAANVNPQAGPKVDAGPRVDTGPRVEMGPKAAPGAKAGAARPAVVREKRRVAALAAVVALATVAGAIGGALATSFMTRQAADEGAATTADPDLQASVTRIDGDVQALKTSVDQIAKGGQDQLSDTNDRLDRLEKEQADTSARLLKLGEATDRLRAAPQASTAMAAVAPVMPRSTTGSVAQPPAASAPARAAPKVDIGRLPIVEGWVLRDVGRGGAVIEGKRGFYEVYAGDPVPGLGRVDAIRKQDGRWVVVTTKGLVVSR